MSEGPPKRPSTAYVLFCNDIRAGIVEQNPGMAFAEIGRTLGQRWKNLSEEDQKPYRERAEKLMSKWKAETDQWKRMNPDQPINKKKNKTTDAKVRKRKDPNAPKKPLSAYMFFSKDARPRLRDETPGVSFADLGRMIGEAWSQLPESKKKAYEVQAAEDKLRYENEMADYNADAASEDDE